jgi:hypothetical protein
MYDLGLKKNERLFSAAVLPPSAFFQQQGKSFWFKKSLKPFQPLIQLSLSDVIDTLL